MGSITEIAENQSPSQSLEQILQNALDSAQDVYSKKYVVSKQNHQEACNYMPGGNTRTVLHISPFPLTIETGDSCYLTIADGPKLIDFLNEYSAGIYGHNNKVIRIAVEEACQKGWNFGGVTRVESMLAKTVCERFPAIDLVRFVNSGTEANMMPLATALAFTRKKAVLMFQGAYHGGTISGQLYQGKANINLPHQFVISRFNDIQHAHEVIDTVKDDLAAIIVEPMMGSGGCYAATPEFLHALRDLATQHEALLILDEVMTSRLAYRGLGHAHGIKPDLMSLGKWIGGGMTFGAFGGRKDVMKMYDPRTGELQHPGTFNNNVFTMTAGIAGCKIMDEMKLNNLNRMGDEMRSALSGLFQGYGIEGQLPKAPLNDDQHLSGAESKPPKMFVSGVGSMMNIHFSGPQRSHMQGLYYHHMLESGFYMAQRGYIALSIEIKQEHVDSFVQSTNDFCQTWQKALRW